MTPQVVQDARIFNLGLHPNACFAPMLRRAVQEDSMRQYEFRLLDADGKVSVTRHHACETDEAAVEAGLKLMSGYRWVEIWTGPRAVARFSCH